MIGVATLPRMRRGFGTQRRVGTQRAASLHVIGYGNPLRGDDALGPRVVAGLRVPGVRTLILHQLGPELAADLALMRRVIFVDARIGRGGPQIKKLRPAAAMLNSHHSEPAGLLALSKLLYGRAPQAWLLSIPAQSFELGAKLSPAARRNRAITLRRLRLFVLRFCGEAAKPKHTSPTRSRVAR